MPYFSSPTNHHTRQELSMPEYEQNTEPEPVKSDQNPSNEETLEAAPVEFEQLSGTLEEVGEKNIKRFDDVQLKISIELGRVAMTIGEVVKMKEGTILETEKLSGQAMEILVNGKLFGRGEVVVVGENLAVRITELEKPDLN